MRGEIRIQLDHHMLPGQSTEGSRESLINPKGEGEGVKKSSPEF